MANTNVEVELLRFRDAANKGYALAKENFGKIENSLKNAEQHIEKVNAKQDQIQKVQSTVLLSRQNTELQELRKNIERIKGNIEDLREKQKDFTIVVFGRAMSGKSTLMEILTHGKGNSIGKGAQRTTTDIRSYYWHGLKIIDMPSIDFFDNEQSDKIGMETAKSADLILFLLTNETPIVEEAQCLAQLKILGKPILGVINVKKNLNFKRQDAELKELNKIFSHDEEIKKILAQFKDMSKNFNQDWNDIKFLPTHLAAAYHADANNNAQIYEASHFNDVKNYILEKVKTDGKFLRIKTFVDSVAVPMNIILMKIFEHAAISLKESKIFLNNSKKIKAWQQNFWERSQNKLYQIFSELSENLNYEILKFAEHNYKEKNINEKWAQRINQFGYVERYQQLLETVSAECLEELKKLNDHLIQELEIFFNGELQKNIGFESAETFKKYIAVTLPKISAAVPKINYSPEEINNKHTSIFGAFFERKDVQTRDAKKNLQSQLNDATLEMLAKINNQARYILNKQILGNINIFIDALINYSHILAQLGKSQSEIAETLIGDHEELNSILFMEAINYKNAGHIYKVKATMRIPGEISVIIAEDSDIDTQKISELLEEKFIVMSAQENWNDTMKKVLECDFDLDTYQIEIETDEKTFSVTPKEKISEQKLKLAQQISPYPIMNNY